MALSQNGATDLREWQKNFYTVFKQGENVPGRIVISPGS